MRTRDTSSRKAVGLLWLGILALTGALAGDALATAASSADQAARAKEFLSDPNVTSCTLTTTSISTLDFPNNQLPSFVRRLQQQNKTDVKQGWITLANRPFRILLGQGLTNEFYLFDVEKQFGPYWWGSWSLYSHHKIDDRFYEFALLEDGAKIAARPYQGRSGRSASAKGTVSWTRSRSTARCMRRGPSLRPLGRSRSTGPARCPSAGSRSATIRRT